jgi:hypothetical protein
MVASMSSAVRREASYLSGSLLTTIIASEREDYGCTIV